MLVHAVTKNGRTAAASLRDIGILHCSQLEHVEVPRSVIDLEAIVDNVAAVAIIKLGPHHISQAHWLAAKFREGQRQPALTLVIGVIDDEEMAGARIGNPGACNEVVGGPVAGPGRLRLDL